VPSNLQDESDHAADFNEELRLFVEVAATIGQFDLDSAERAVAYGAQRLARADAGIVGLFDQERREIVLTAASGCVQDSTLPTIAIEGRLGGEALEAEEPLTIGQGSVKGTITPLEEWIGEEGVSSALVVPMLRSGDLFGLVAVLFQRRHVHSAKEKVLLTQLARHATVSLGNARLHQQVRTAVALEERDRLAREMHDGVAQNLSYIHFKTE